MTNPVAREELKYAHLSRRKTKARERVQAELAAHIEKILQEGDQSHR